LWQVVEQDHAQDGSNEGAQWQLTGTDLALESLMAQIALRSCYRQKMAEKPWSIYAANPTNAARE
jgi:hypothetical protein